MEAARDLKETLRVAQKEQRNLVSGNESQHATKQALGDIIPKLAEYAEAIGVLPRVLADVSPSQMQTVCHAAEAAKEACDHLSTVAPGLPALEVQPLSGFPGAARTAARDSKLRAFLMKLQNNILNQSQYGRNDIIEAVAGVNNMELNPKDAATSIEGVILNRQGLLDQLSAMNVPDDQRAVKVYDLLQASLQHSIEADRYYAAWMHDVDRYYYMEPEGYMGNVPHDGNYEKALSHSNMSGASKSSFCKAYNSLARSFGMRSDWNSGQI